MIARSSMIWLSLAFSVAALTVTASSAWRAMIASRRSESGMRATKVPDFGMTSTRRSFASLSTASRTGVRLMP